MRILLSILLRYQNFLVFVILQTACFWLIFNHNNYQSAVYFTSANLVAARVNGTISNFTDYFALREQNQYLQEQNQHLMQQLEHLKITDTLSSAYTGLSQHEGYRFIAAKVINNSYTLTNNHLTIDKGSRHGIEPGMGVVTPGGIVGKVKICSPNTSVVYSVLHSDVQVAARFKKNKVLGTVKWEPYDIRQAGMFYVPMHEKIFKGDTVVTAGFNTVYPEGYPVGVVSKVEHRRETAFLDITVELATRFNAISHVYVVDNRLRQEADSLERITVPGTKSKSN
jgi:rod shape-determining protein MreC